MTPLSALRAVSMPLALLLSLAAHAGLIAAILGFDDAPMTPPRPGGVIAVEIVLDGPTARPGPETPRAASGRGTAPDASATAAAEPAVRRSPSPRPTLATRTPQTRPTPVVPPRARRKPRHLADTAMPLQKPAAVNRISAHPSRSAQPDGAERPGGLIRATLTPAARSRAGDRGASARGDNPKPAYPFVARQRGQEGQVLLTVEVAPDGTADRVEIARSSGFPGLDDAARRAVARWRFNPARHGGAAVAARVTVPIRFSLR